MTTHEGHNHPATPAGRNWCRKLKLADRPFVTNHTTYDDYLIQTFDVKGRLLDMDGTPEGDFFSVSDTSAVVWVMDNLRYGVLHDWDAETHTIHAIRELIIWHTTGGMAEVHPINLDGTRGPMTFRATS